MSNILAILNNVWTIYADMMKTNPVIGGAFTLYGMGVFTWVFKSVPARIFNYITSQFTVAVAIHNNDVLFIHITQWLEKGDRVFRCKSFTATLKSRPSTRSYRYIGGVLADEEEDHKSVVHISVGQGNHIFFYNKRIFWLSRVEKEANATTDRKESLYISTYGWYPDAIKNFLQNVVPKPSKDTTDLYYYSDGYWYTSSDKPVRKLDSVVMTAKNEKAVRDHIRNYLTDKDWYRDKKIPWRTGIILEGPPGTGKSTLSLALCGEFNCNLYIANLSSVSDDKIIKMFKSLPAGSVMLIEDIDSYSIANSRKKVKVKGRKPLRSGDDDDDDEDMAADGSKLFGSLSGLLNAIDGLNSTEDRILIATTNHIDKLDPALIRPGRFELIMKIDNLDNETCAKMFKKFYPDFKLPEGFKVAKDLSPAAFQTLAIGNKQSPQVLLDFCSGVKAKGKK